MPVVGFRRNATAGTPKALAADTKYLTRVTVARTMRVPKLTALLDGLAGGGPDPQPMRAVIYAVDGVNPRVAEGEEVEIPVGAEASWVDLPFPDAGGVVLEAGEYDIGVICGGQSVARLATVSGVGTRSIGTDTYGQVITQLTEEITLPTATINVVSTTGFDSIGQVDIGDNLVNYTSKEATKLQGATGGSGMVADETDVTQEGASVIRDQPEEPAEEEGEFQIFATYFLEAAVPDVDDAHIARYPFSYAQALLGDIPPLEGSARTASCTWHGTRQHPERGSFMLVQRDGEFTDLIGHRVRISEFGGGSVYAYVIAAADLEEADDLSLTRRLFMALAPLATESLGVRVEILSAEGADT